MLRPAGALLFMFGFPVPQECSPSRQQHWPTPREGVNHLRALQLFTCALTSTEEILGGLGADDCFRPHHHRPNNRDILLNSFILCDIRARVPWFQFVYPLVSLNPASLPCMSPGPVCEPYYSTFHISLPGAASLSWRHPKRR